MTDRTPYLEDVLADLHTAKALMNDARPLEALQTINRAIERIEQEIDE